MTVKRYRDALDAEALTQLSSDDDPESVEVLSDTQVRITIARELTSDWPLGDLWYDVQAEPNAAETYTAAHGSIKLRARPTRNVVQPPQLLRVLEDSLLHWWEVPAAAGDYMQLNTGNVARLVDRVPAGFTAGGLVKGGCDMVQAIAGQQPAHHATGGPGDGAYTETSASSYNGLLATGLGIPSGSRVGFYALMRHNATDQIPCGPVSDAIPGLVYTAAAPNTVIVYPESGPPQGGAVATPWGSGWHLHAFRPLASGFAYEVDGVDAESTIVSTAGVQSIDSVQIGWPSPHPDLGGDVAMIFVVDNPTAAIDRALKDYIAMTRGFALS